MKRTASLWIMLAGLLLAPVHANAAGTQAPVIIALGDSLTAGLGLPQDQSFPAQLEAALKARGTDAPVLRVGFVPAYQRATGMSVYLPASLPATDIGSQETGLRRPGHLDAPEIKFSEDGGAFG